MKNFNIKLERYFDRLDRRWRRLPVRKQRLYTLAFFSAYLLLTVVVLSSVVYSTLINQKQTTAEYKRTPLSIESETAGSIADSSSTTLKTKQHER